MMSIADYRLRDSLIFLDLRQWSFLAEVGGRLW